MGKKTKLMLGDNIESLKKLPDNSIDSVVTDPPYGLSFMAKKWDYDVPSVEFWRQVYRVLKPGGHILSFGGTRTYHRMVVNIEDAGFEIRDQIMWLYGSGFPKSHNIGKAIDKIEGNEREVKEYIAPDGKKRTGVLTGDEFYKSEGDTYNNDTRYKTKGSSPYEGFGTALKPANEPICLARKPLSEKSVAENVLKWRTGGINIDGCRVGSEVRTTPVGSNDSRDDETLFGLNKTTHHERVETTEGRFPANLILECICDEVIPGEKGQPFSYVGKEYNNKDLEDGRSIDFLKGSKSEGPSNYNDKGDIHTNPECPCYQLDEQSGISKSRSKYPQPSLDNMPMNHYEETKIKHISGREQTKEFISDKGGASRFFYIAKVSKKERNMGLDGFEEKKLHNINQLDDRLRPDGTLRETPVHRNTHPTLKPINLMIYLCRLVTPEGGIVLDPFMGSGSTGIAALLEGFRFVGMEMDKDYFKIAEARIDNYQQYREFLKK